MAHFSHQARPLRQNFPWTNRQSWLQQVFISSQARPNLKRFSSSHVSHTPGSAPSSSTSVDQAEIEHFNQLASSWWDPYGPSRLLHQMNPIRHDFIRTCHGQALHTYGDRNTGVTTGEAHGRSGTASSHRFRYLDVGCGGGIFAESAARMPDTDCVVGIDASIAVIDVARKHASTDTLLNAANAANNYENDVNAVFSQLQSGSTPLPRLTYINTTIESLPSASSSSSSSLLPASDTNPTATNGMFDIVSLFEVLEHVNSPDQFLQSAAKHVKPGGWLVGSTISRTAVSWITTKLAAEHVLGIVPVGTHDWNKYINPDELRGWTNRLSGQWNGLRLMGAMYVPAIGWVSVPDGISPGGGASMGNYFFGIQRTQ